MEKCKKKYYADLPYPEPQIKFPNTAHAKILLEDYAGESVSELPAILQYMYGHFVLDGYPEVKEMLRCIAIVEMHHLELLADTIDKLGIDPRYRTINAKNTDVYFKTDKINYVKSVNNILLGNIQGEKAAVAQYKLHMSMIDDPEINKLLERIILDEELHIRELTGMYEDINTPLEFRQTPGEDPAMRPTDGSPAPREDLRREIREETNRDGRELNEDIHREEQRELGEELREDINHEERRKLREEIAREFSSEEPLPDILNYGNENSDGNENADKDMHETPLPWWKEKNNK